MARAVARDCRNGVTAAEVAGANGIFARPRHSSMIATFFVGEVVEGNNAALVAFEVERA